MVITWLRVLKIALAKNRPLRVKWKGLVYFFVS
jgi:hypothetical protein